MKNNKDELSEYMQAVFTQGTGILSLKYIDGKLVSKNINYSKEVRNESQMETN